MAHGHEVALFEFVRLLERGDVVGVWFYGNMAEVCVFEDKDGMFRSVGEGYPVEDARSNQSALHVVARVRERGVPYYLVPKLTGLYGKRGT